MTCAQKLLSEGQAVRKKRNRATPIAEGIRKNKTIRVSDEEWAEFTKRAEAYFGGDVTGWIRFTAGFMTPDEEQIRLMRAFNEESKILK